MDTAVRVFARDAAGTLHDPMAFTGWSCDGPIAPDPSQLGGAEKAPLVYMEAHQGPPGRGEALQIVRQTWRFRDGVAEPEITEEPLLACTAVPTDETWQYFLWQR